MCPSYDKTPYYGFRGSRILFYFSVGSLTLPTKMGSLLSRSTTKYLGMVCGESWQRNSKSLRFLPEWERSRHYYSIPVNADSLWFWIKRCQSYGCGRGCRGLHPGLVHLDDKIVEGDREDKVHFCVLFQKERSSPYPYYVVKEFLRPCSGMATTKLRLPSLNGTSSRTSP